MTAHPVGTEGKPAITPITIVFPSPAIESPRHRASISFVSLSQPTKLPRSPQPHVKSEAGATRVDPLPPIVPKEFPKRSQFGLDPSQSRRLALSTTNPLGPTHAHRRSSVPRSWSRSLVWTCVQLFQYGSKPRATRRKPPERSSRNEPDLGVIPIIANGFYPPQVSNRSTRSGHRNGRKPPLKGRIRKRPRDWPPRLPGRRIGSIGALALTPEIPFLVPGLCRKRALCNQPRTASIIRMTRKRKSRVSLSATISIGGAVKV